MCGDGEGGEYSPRRRMGTELRSILDGKDKELESTPLSRPVDIPIPI